jgi:hypothetical protein
MGETKVDEKPCETKPKKMVRRSVAIALGMICILLIAVIAYFSIAGISAQNSYNNLQNQNNQLQTWLNGNITYYNSQIANLTNQKNQLQTWLSENITSYETQISTLNARITQMQTWLNGNITAYNSYVADHHHTDEDYTNFYNISNLADSAVWVNDQTISQPAGASTSWTEPVNYAGYVSVSVQTSSVAGTHVRVTYSAYGVSFDQEIVVSAGGTAVFPILPSNVTVEVGNSNNILEGGATENVTITYYY